MVGKLLSRLSSQSKEVISKPDLFQMGLMRILSQNLLNRQLPSRLLLNPQPNQTKPSSPQQPSLNKMAGKPIPKVLILILRQILLTVVNQLYAFLLLAQRLVLTILTTPNLKCRVVLVSRMGLTYLLNVVLGSEFDVFRLAFIF